MRACRFALPHKQQLLGVPAGQHVKVRVTSRSGEALEQAFNPISTDDTPGEVTLLVKVPANLPLRCVPTAGSHATRSTSHHQLSYCRRGSSRRRQARCPAYAFWPARG